MIENYVSEDSGRCNDQLYIQCLTMARATGISEFSGISRLEAPAA